MEFPSLILTHAGLRDRAGELFAAASDCNVLEERSPALEAKSLVWSGWMGDGVFERDFRTWMRGAWDRLDGWCDRVDGRLVIFRPHPRHVLADPQSCLTFMRRRASQGFSLLLSPTGFLTPSMLNRADEHIHRAMESLVDFSAAILLHNVVSAPDANLLQVSPLHEGLLPPKLMRELAAAAQNSGRPVAMIEPDIASQVASVG